SKKKVQRIHYQVKDAIAEFDFIDLKFKPNLENYKPDSYKIWLQNLRQYILNLVKKHFNLYPKIPSMQMYQYKILNTKKYVKNNFLENVNDENIDPELCQYCKSKISALEHLVKHLNNELN
ncbi:12060_t:CDS:2, partial [Racocetra fulgida]